MKVNEVLSRDEIASFMQKSDWAGLRKVVINYAMIAGIMAVVAIWPSVFTVVPAMVLLGGRQLGLAVIMHDSAHKGMFKTPWLNGFVGRWLAGSPIWSNMDSYFQKHARHHIAAGSDDDPDLENYRHYAVSKASFRRKILRDLTGLTGIKTLYLTARYGGLPVMWRSVVVNGLMLAGFALIGYPWLYALWMVSWLTTNMLFSRLRQAAEHAVVPDLGDSDPRMHTRTTYANWWERLTVAPNHVNYHLEHHLMPSVPPHQLARLHRTLRERGFYEQADIASGYDEVVAKLTIRKTVDGEDVTDAPQVAAGG